MDDSTQDNRLTAQEKHYFYNTLAVLIKAVIGHKTTVDLRNETTIYGKIQHADAFMNITMKDCYFTDPRGNTYKYDMFFVHTRNIRSVHVPPHIRIIPAIKEEMKNVFRGDRVLFSKSGRTLREKRMQQKQKRDLQLKKEILTKTQNIPSTSKE